MGSIFGKNIGDLVKFLRRMIAFANYQTIAAILFQPKQCVETLITVLEHMSNGNHAVQLGEEIQACQSSS